jgi:hypothetical protein
MRYAKLLILQKPTNSRYQLTIAISALFLVSSCTINMRPIEQVLSFDRRYVFDIASFYPEGEPFPFAEGERVRIPVAIYTHPLREWVFEEISPEALWYGSLRPNGTPDPNDPFGETLLIDISGAEAQEEAVQFAWRVDNDDLLLAVVDSEPVPETLARAEIGTAIPAVLTMEISFLEAFETDSQGESRVWRLVLIPAGEERNNLILSEVEITRSR